MTTTEARGPWARLVAPVDPASLAAFRALYGLVMAYGALRFLATGWADVQLGAPRFFFRYPGFEWVPVPPVGLAEVLLAVEAAAAIALALGLFTRLSAAVVVVTFAWVQLADVTNYLNHAWLAVLLGALLAVAPSNAALSLDGRLFPRVRRARIRGGWLRLVQAQIALVYLFAAAAKVHPDWLLHGQPLGIWLAARTDLPLLGPLLALDAAPLLFSWAGFLYDATIVLWLSLRRTRPLAFVLVLAFHGTTHALFQIGVFPLLMTAAATLFFAPDWPRRLLRLPHAAIAPAPAPLPRAARALAAAAFVAWAAVEVALPLRHLALPGDVLWNEEGMRWSWKVMVREKAGSVTYLATRLRDGRTFEVPPSAYLEPRQEMEFSGQPDLIAALARHVAADLEAQGHGPVAVRAEAWVSWNGRPPALLLDPSVDLARLPAGELATALRPAPASPPLATKLALR